MLPKVTRILLLLAYSAMLHACARETPEAEPQTVTISVIGTNDIHGQISDIDGNRGLALLGGYVDNLRAVREGDGGAVLLIDAGDMWQGTLESNLTEGAFMVEAFNALGYDAVTIGNHEFDFGPVGEMAIPESDADDPHGALRERAIEADFPLLTANIIDESSGAPLSMPNVTPSVMLEAAGLRVGVIGVLSEGGLSATIAANAEGLRMAPLASTIAAEARALRDKGADLVIVTAHAGSMCETFDDPIDLSSCRMDGEIMQVAADLPPGLVDQIIAGHVHMGIAHEVNGVAITSSFSNAVAFGRVDHTIDLDTRSVTARRIHPPHRICGFVVEGSGSCASESDEGAVRAKYAGAEVHPAPDVLAVADKAAALVQNVKSEPLGVYLETPFTRELGTRSPLGHLFMDAIYASTDADVVIHNVMGGLRADLPAGDLVYGSAYELYPFDNRVTALQLSGAELRSVIEAQAMRTSRRAGFSGMRVFADCDEGELDVVMQRPDGTAIADDEALTVITTDFLAMAGDGVFAPVVPEEGFAIPSGTPLVREIFVSWMRDQGGRMHADDFMDNEKPRWNVADSVPGNCGT